LFETDIRVRWVDTDRLQVVHYSNYFRYFEVAEEEFLRSLGLDFQRLNETYGIAIPRIEAHCIYKAPARFNDLVRVSVVVKEIAGKTVLYEFAVRNKNSGTLLAEGWIRVAAVDLKTWKAVNVPPDIVKILNST
jgi:acyl-CoA thioester hydrolase